mgnify:CR=1 FL=1
MSLIDNAVYIDGHRKTEPASVDQTIEALRECQQDCAHRAEHGEHPNIEGCFCWIGMLRPDESEIMEVAEEFGLHTLSVEDTVNAHQRPKLEQYGDQLFVVFRPARYIDETEKVEFGELHVFLGPDFVVTIRHAESPELSAVRSRLEADHELLTLGTEAVM